MNDHIVIYKLLLVSFIHILKYTYNLWMYNIVVYNTYTKTIWNEKELNGKKNHT